MKNKSGKTFSARLEGFDRMMGNKSNKPAKAPADVSQAFARANKKAKKPKLKADKMKGK